MSAARIHIIGAGLAGLAAAVRLRVVTASARSFPARMCGSAVEIVAK